MSSITALVSRRRLSRIAVLASLALATVPSGAHAQTATAFKACTQGSLANCAVIQLTSGTEWGANYFEIMIRNLGSTTGFPTSIDFLSFAAGGQDLGSGVSDGVVPKAVGGATLTDPAPWDVFVGSDAIFLSSLDNHGVGGCVAGADVGPAGQAGQTCGADSFLAFKFFTPNAYDPFAVTLLDMQVTELTDGVPAELCSNFGECLTTPVPVSATPEPSSVLLALTGFSAVAGLRLRRRRAQT